ncbi:hypothetical protein ACLEVF_26940 [Escherichia coli]
MSAHFVRFPDCQFVDRAEQLWHENGRMICCPVARTARLRGGRRGAKKLPTLRQCSGDTNPQKSGQDVGMSDRARSLRHSPPGQGFAPTPRQRLTAREKIPRTAHRS